MTQREAVKIILTEKPTIEFEEAFAVAESRFHLNIHRSTFYMMRSDMGFGVRRNGKQRLTADKVKTVREFLNSYLDQYKQREFIDNFIELVNDIGIGSIIECMKVIKQS